MNFYLLWPGVVVCAAILLACICRVDQLKAGRHRTGWIAMHILYAVFALGVAIDLVVRRPVDWWVCFGIAGILLHLFLTRDDWKHGPPPDLEKQS